MKKLVIILAIILVGIVCLAPLPRRVDCQAKDVQAKGWYLDFLFLDDRFYGKVMADGNEYEPSDNHGAYTYKGLTAWERYYVIPVFRYRVETNDVDMRTIYLQKNLKDVYEWN